MKNISNIKLNILLEKLYVESSVNRIFEEISDFDDLGWIKDSNPTLKDPDFTFNGYEYWVDLDTVPIEEKCTVIQYILKKLNISPKHNNTFCRTHFLECDELNILNGICVHCGSDNTDYVPTKNNLCCMENTRFEDDEFNQDSIYVDGSELLNYIKIKNSLNENHNILLETSEDDKTIFKKVMEDLGLTRRLVFTFSAGIAAMLGPVTSLLEGSGVHLNKTQVVMLLISGIASAIGQTESERMVKRLKEEGIYQYLKNVVGFILDVKKLIDSILDKVLKATYGLTDILGFTFIMVPVMKILDELINSYGTSFDSFKTLIVGLIGGTITYGVKQVIDKIRKRLS